MVFCGNIDISSLRIAFIIIHCIFTLMMIFLLRWINSLALKYNLIYRRPNTHYSLIYVGLCIVFTMLMLVDFRIQEAIPEKNIISYMRIGYIYCFGGISHQNNFLDNIMPVAIGVLAGIFLLTIIWNLSICFSKKKK